ncbi:MAG: class I SAM-dependent methyltransferase [Campylobacterota bacterium]|nr:class I SAM-dependent methyltransferase [Campylobacterota bacterium]
MSSIDNKKRFNTLAQEWDTKPQRVEGAMIFVDKIIDLIDQDISDFNILDYGSGSGLVSFGFSNKVKNIIGLDNSEAMVEVYNQKSKNLNLNNIQSKLHDINKEILDLNYFDLIATNMTMHHIKDINLFIKKLYDALKTNGDLFIADLVLEDGKFHSDNTGVEHFGFDTDEIKSIFNNCGSIDIHCEILNTIDKEHNSYDVFIIKGKKI